MAIHLSLTLLRESKWPRAAFYLLPTLSTNAIPFQEKIFCCGSMKTFLCCHLEFFLLWKWVQRRSEGFLCSLECEGSSDSSCIPLHTAVSLAKSRFWIVASLGHRENLPSASSLWVQERDKGWAWRLRLLSLTRLFLHVPQE